MEKGTAKNYHTTAVDYGTRTVHQILEHGKKEEILRILQHEMNPNFIGENGNSMLLAILKNYKLIENDIVGFLTHFLTRGADPNFKNIQGQTALHLAIERRMVNVVNLLLKFKVNLHVVDSYGNSIAHFFIEDEHEKCKDLLLLPILNTPEYRKTAEKSTVSFLEFLISIPIDFYVRNANRFDPLRLAIERNLPHILPTLLDYNFPTVKGNNCNFEILADAIHEKKDIHIIKEMINFYLNKCDKKAATTLFIKLVDTCRSWSKLENDYFLTVLRNLIAKGASVNDKPSRKNLVNTAINANNISLLKLFNESVIANKVLHYLAEDEASIMSCEDFIRNFCDVNAKNECKKTALHVAISCNNRKMVRLLIELNAEINCKDKYFRTPLHEALHEYKSIQLIELLLTSGADANAPDYEGRMPLHFAVENNNLSVIQLLLDHGAFANCKDAKKQTPLHGMKTCVSKEIIELLLSHGADVNATNYLDESLLHVAISQNNTSVVRTLMEYGALVNCKNRYQETPLQRAMLTDNSLEVVEMLLMNEADVNIKDPNGDMPLHLAISQNNFSSVQLLIKYGASMDCKNKRQQTPLHLAMVSDREGKIVELLLASGADANVKDAEGNTPLHQIFQRRSLDVNKELIMKILLRNGAYVNARDAQGKTALCHAFWSKETRLVNALLEYSADPHDSSVKSSLSKYHKELPQDFLQHLIKLEAADLYVEREYKTLYGDSYACMQNYYESCLEEIKKLKNTTVGNGRLLYDFLHMSPKTRGALYINREEVLRLVESPDLKQKFPIYSVLILASYHDAVIKKPLLQPAKEALQELIPAVMPDVIDHILDYLNEIDLVNIIEANTIVVMKTSLKMRRGWN